MTEAEKRQILDKITEHHCELLQKPTNPLLIKNCAMVHIAPSGHIFVNTNLPDKDPMTTYKDHFKVLHTLSGFDLPVVVIHWNRYCRYLNESFREGWRFNFEVEYVNDEHHVLGLKPWTDYFIYDIPTCQEIWLNIIRQYRDKSLLQLDQELMLALEEGDTDGVAEIGLIKKMLRDLPAEINIGQYDSYAKIVTFWPTLLLPAPDFVAKAPPTLMPLDDIPAAAPETSSVVEDPPVTVPALVPNISPPPVVIESSGIDMVDIVKRKHGNSKRR